MYYSSVFIVPPQGPPGPNGTNGSRGLEGQEKVDIFVVGGRGGPRPLKFTDFT